jgi:hypothetical protein
VAKGNAPDATPDVCDDERDTVLSDVRSIAGEVPEGSVEPLSDENLEELLRREIPERASSSTSVTSATLGGTVADEHEANLLLGDLPLAARRIVEVIRLPDERVRIVDDFERRKFGWDSRVRTIQLPYGETKVIALDRVEVRRAWRRLLSGKKSDRHLAELRAFVDNVRAKLHGGNIVTGSWPETLSTVVENAVVNDGILVVSDPKSRDGSPGDAAYMEQTPPAVLVVVAKFARAHYESAGHRWMAPTAWDLTAGSGTGEATLGPLGWKVVSTDLVNPNDAVGFLDARNLGDNDFHRRPIKIEGKQPGPAKVDERRVIVRPHVIVFDPPSRGVPTHSERYQGCLPEQDMAVLARDEYIETVARISKGALERLRLGGSLLLVIRECARAQQRITPDIGLAQEIVAAIGPTKVVTRFEVVYEERRNQFSLGKARPPIKAFVLARTT